MQNTSKYTITFDFKMALGFFFERIEKKKYFQSYQSCQCENSVIINRYTAVKKFRSVRNVNII